MAKSISAAATNQTLPGFGSTRYSYLQGNLSYGSGELEHRAICHRNGTFNNFTTFASANSLDASATVYVMINDVAGNQSVSISSTSTGYFTDASNNDGITSGQTFYQKAVLGGTVGSIAFEHSDIVFDDSSATASFLIAGSGNPPVYNLNATTAYGALNGVISASPMTTLEAGANISIYAAGTLSNLYARGTSNSRTTSTTLKSRVNGADGNMTLSIPATTTGMFTDASNSDTLSEGDVVCMSVLGGAETTNLYLKPFGAVLVTSDGDFEFTSSNGSGMTLNGATRYNSPGPAPYSDSSEANHKLDAKVAFSTKKLRAYIYSNAATVSGTVKSRKNGADGSQTFSIPAGNTGWFVDSSNTDSYSIGDDLSIYIYSGSGGSCVWCSLGITGNIPLAPTGGAKNFNVIII